MSEKKRGACVGISGRILGHKFAWGGIDQTRKIADHCLRCGMPQGGWPASSAPATESGQA